MNKNLTVSMFAIALLLSTTALRADDTPLIGTWKLISYFRETSDTGERYNQLGEHPNGYISYSNDGRMSAIISSDDRIKTREDRPTDEERIKLHKSMIAYAGTYSVASGKVTHDVDISWNETWTGTEQVRFYTLDGNILTIKTASNKSLTDGREGVAVLVWEKVKGRGQ